MRELPHAKNKPSRRTHGIYRPSDSCSNARRSVSHLVRRVCSPTEQAADESQPLKRNRVYTCAPLEESCLLANFYSPNWTRKSRKPESPWNACPQTRKILCPIPSRCLWVSLHRM